MLELGKVSRLCDILGVREDEFRDVAENLDEHIVKLAMFDPLKPREVPRVVRAVRGPLRRIQARLYQRVLLPRLQPSPFNHGGIRGRSVITNAKAHQGGQFLFSLDIASFFPSVGNKRVNRMLLHQLRCSPTVAHFLTKLCTHEYHLALGLTTSPILADQVLRGVDHRIDVMCRKQNLVYTRFVDDLVISGPFDMEGSFVVQHVEEILRSCGFRMQRKKLRFAEIDSSALITGIRPRGGHVDVSKQFATELDRQLADHQSLASGGPFRGPLLTSSALDGKVRFASWVNPGRRSRLRHKFRAIRWDGVWKNAKDRGLVFAEKRLMRIGDPAPDFSQCYGSNLSHLVRVAGAVAASNNECPFDAESD